MLLGIMPNNQSLEIVKAMVMYNILTKCPLFRGFDEGRIKELLDHYGFELTEYSAGDLIAQREVAYSGLMIILKGSVLGEITDSKGNKVKVDEIFAPQLIAPAFLFGGYNRLPMNIIAGGNTTIITIHRGQLFEMMQNNTVILSNFIDIISNRANMFQKKIYYLSFQGVKAKLANYIIDRTVGGSDSIEKPDMQVLAEYFDVTRSSVESVYQAMLRKGWIKEEGSRLKIVSPKSLEALSENTPNI